MRSTNQLFRLTKLDYFLFFVRVCFSASYLPLSFTIISFCRKHITGSLLEGHLGENIGIWWSVVSLVEGWRVDTAWDAELLAKGQPATNWWQAISPPQESSTWWLWGCFYGNSHVKACFHKKAPLVKGGLAKFPGWWRNVSLPNARLHVDRTCGVLRLSCSSALSQISQHGFVGPGKLMHI